MWVRWVAVVALALLAGCLDQSHFTLAVGNATDAPAEIHVVLAPVGRGGFFEGTFALGPHDNAARVLQLPPGPYLLVAKADEAEWMEDIAIGGKTLYLGVGLSEDGFDVDHFRD